MKNFPRYFMVSMTFALLVGLFLAITPTFARSTGRSGKYGGSVGSCNECHSGGVAPTVTLDGRTTLEPGEAATYQLLIQSNNVGVQTHAGLDVAVLDAAAAKVGTLVIGDTDTQIMESEIVHTGPKMGDNSGLTTFSFSYIAPTTPGEYTIYYAGNSVDLKGSPDGDQATVGTTKIVVSSPSAVTLQRSATQTNEIVAILSLLTLLGGVTIGVSRHFGRVGTLG